nr:MAG TPA: hypothetical protein [Caudoviricetes sp.]
MVHFRVDLDSITRLTPIGWPHCWAGASHHPQPKHP